MRWFAIFLVSLLIFPLVSAATGVVNIVPETPSADDTLTASVDGQGSTVFDFYWMKDGATYKHQKGSSSTLESSYTSPGDTWTVSVWTPASALYDNIKYGSASVTIVGGEEPEYPGGDLVIEPKEPCESADLKAYVDGYEGTVFDFYWMKGGAVYKEETGTSTTLPEEYTKESDTWTVSAWTPTSALYDSIEYDSASVTIGPCEGEGTAEPEATEAPRATGISLTVNEEDFVDIEVDVVNSALTYFFKVIQTGIGESSVVYVYDPDSPEEDLSWTYSSPLDANGDWQTVVGDAGTYTSTFTVQDAEKNTGTATITLKVNGKEEENQCPTLTSQDITVTEGDLAVLSYTTNDADGDTVTVTFSDLFDENGQWQTQDGDAGTYAVTVTATDGECATEFQVTVVVNEKATENQCPVITAQDISVTEGDLAVLSYTTNDADGDPVTVTFSDLFDENGQWQTQDGDAGTYAVTVTATDGECATEFQVTVVVNEKTAEENHPPILEDIDDIEVNEGELVTIEAIATDQDNDVLTYTFEGISGDVNGNVLTWQTTYHDAGEYPVVVTVSDGELTDSTTLTVKVDDVCEDKNEDNICDTPTRSNFESHKLYLKDLMILNAEDLYSAYDLSGLAVQTSGVYYVENGLLRRSDKNDYLIVAIEFLNKNSFDAEDMDVRFFLDDKEIFVSGFPSLDRSEKTRAIYNVPIPDNLKTGSYGLKVAITNGDFTEERVFNVDILSTKDSIEYQSTENSEEVPKVKSIWERFWNKVKDLLS